MAANQNGLSTRSYLSHMHRDSGTGVSLRIMANTQHIKCCIKVASLVLVCWVSLVGVKDAVNREYLRDSLKGVPTLPATPTGYFPYFTRLNDSTVPLTLSCATCAVVFNSGHLLDSTEGSDIDRKACVIRMNDAPAGGQFQKHVGTKTSLRLLSKRGILEYLDHPVRGDGKDMKLLVWDESLRPPRKDDLTIKILEHTSKNTSLDIYVLNKNPSPDVESFPRLFEREIGISKFLSGTAESTGFYAMQAAGHICHSIHIYGLAPPDFCQKNRDKFMPYHYYGQDKIVDECSFYKTRERKLFQGHQFHAEHLIFQRWAQYKNITFKAPDWQ